MTTANRVTGIDYKPNANGDQIIEITCADGHILDAAIDLAAAQTLVEILQRRLVHWAHENAKNLSLPQVDVSHVDLAHKGPASQLMVTTERMGILVLQMQDDLLRKARSEIDRALTLRSPSQAAH
jgi:hypothetical protein